jgi:F0F1-type ATP synthase membrane subunit b/b'
LVATASDLKSAGASVAEALQPLRTVAQGLRDLTEQVAGAVSRLEATQTAGARLMEAMTQAAARFEGVDRDLAHTLDQLQTGLRAFTQEVRKFVAETDTNLAKAATHLSSSVKALEDTLADFLSEMRTPR